MGQYGALINRLAPALALAGQGITIGSGARNTSANAISDYASKIAAGGLVRPVAGQAPPATPQAPAQTRVQQAAPTGNEDTNNNGVPDKLEVKATGAGAISNLQKLGLPGLLGGAKDFSVDSGSSVGTPESVSVPTDQYENDARILSGLTSPELVADLTKARMVAEPASMNARAALLTAQEKYSNMDVSRQKIITETEKAFNESALKAAELAGIGPYDPRRIAYATQVKKEAEEQATANVKNSELAAFLKMPLANMPIPEVIRSKVITDPRIRTYGDFAALNKDVGAVKLLFDYYNKLGVAGIRAAGEAKGQYIAAIGQMRMIQQGRVDDAVNRLKLATDPTRHMLDTPEQQKMTASEIMSLQAEIKIANQRLAEIDAMVLPSEHGSSPRRERGNQPTSITLKDGSTVQGKMLPDGTFQGNNGKIYRNK
jgi:hypothetical protein